MKKKLSELFAPKFQKGHIQSFTYYIPAPPVRSTGYREREFDHLVTSLLDQVDYVHKMKTIPNGDKGMWVLFLLEVSSKEKAESLLNFPLESNDESEVVFDLEDSPPLVSLQGDES